MKKKHLAVYLLILIGGHIVALHAQNVIPMRLEDLFQRAEESNRSMYISRMAEQEAEQAIKVSRNALLPTITGEASVSFLGDGKIWNRSFKNGMKADIPHYGNNFALEASQVIYAGGAIRSGINIAKLRQKATMHDSEANRQNVRFFLVGNFLELFKLFNQEKVYVQNITQTKKLIAEINAKQEVGVALKNDVTRYELQLKSLELAVTQIRNAREIINHQLTVALDYPDGTIIGIDTTIIGTLPIINSEKEWQELATQSSPSLQQTRTAIEIAKEQEKAVLAERIPSFALFAGDKLDGPITIEVPPLDNNFNYWYVGIGMKYNFSSLFKSNKKSKLSRLATQRIKENHLLQQDRTRTDVKDAYVRFTEAFTIYDTQIKSLQLAEQNHSVVMNRYLNELALITDMLDADNAKLNAELQVVNARINILFNYYRLKKTTGTL